jgi:surface polysaccharide O-acyltransferase-like enzyme
MEKTTVGPQRTAAPRSRCVTAAYRNPLPLGTWIAKQRAMTEETAVGPLPFAAPPVPRGVEIEAPPESAPSSSDARIEPTSRLDTSKGDTTWVHVVRVVATLFVIVLHVAAEPFYMGVKAGSYEWWIADVYNSATRICVPLFLMLSGHLLLRTTDPTLTFYRKRARRILVPWLSWSLVYLALDVFYEIHHPSGTSAMTPGYLKQIKDAGWKAVPAIALTPMYYHLWFLYMLIWVYLWLPLWRRIVRIASPTMLWSVLGGWAVLSTVLTFTRDAPRSLPMTISVVLFYGLVGALGYPLLGYLLGRIAISKRLFGLMAALAVAGTLTTILGTYVLTMRDGGVLNQSLHGDTLNMIGSTMAGFVVMRYVAERYLTNARSRLFVIVKALSETSFGIYLLHPLLLYALSIGVLGVKATALSHNSLFMIPALAAFAMVASHYIVTAIRRLPYLRAMAG